MAKIDPIDRAAVRALAFVSSDWSHGEHPLVVEISDIDELPTLDVQPVRRGGCEYCNGSGRVLYQETHSVKLYLNSFGDARTIEVEANRCPPFADCAMVNVPARSAFIINYCPNCGADMRRRNE